MESDEFLDFRKFKIQDAPPASPRGRRKGDDPLSVSYVGRFVLIDGLMSEDASKEDLTPCFLERYSKTGRINDRSKLRKHFVSA